MLQVTIKSIAVDPYRGKLYFAYSNANETLIEFCHMDGTERTVLVQLANLSHSDTNPISSR
jgi:hypothetical protein